ncbi:unnamed protein product, partial [Symbiodinium microadriaticum]
DWANQFWDWANQIQITGGGVQSQLPPPPPPLPPSTASEELQKSAIPGSSDGGAVFACSMVNRYPIALGRGRTDSAHFLQTADKADDRSPAMAAEDVRPDPLRASNMAKDDLHGLTLELDGVQPAPFQLAGADGQKEKRHTRSERPTFAEPLVLPVSSQPSDPAPQSPPPAAKPRPRRMSTLGGRGRGKHEARSQVLKSRVSAMFEECIEIANYRLVKAKLETQAQIQQPTARSIASAWPGSVPALQRLLPLKPSQEEVALEPRKVTKIRQTTLPLQRIEIPVGRSRLLDGVQFLQSGDDLGAND